MRTLLAQLSSVFFQYLNEAFKKDWTKVLAGPVATGEGVIVSN